MISVTGQLILRLPDGASAAGLAPFPLIPRSTPGSVESHFLTQAAWVVVLMLFNSNSIGVSMPRLEWRRRRLWKTSMYSKIALASSTRVFQRRVPSGG